jgi:hypothetical protein
MGPEGGFSVPTQIAVAVFGLLMILSTSLPLFASKKAKDGSNLLWGLAFLLRGLGCVGIAFRGSIPDCLSRFLANVLLVAASSLLFCGASAFAGRGKRLRLAGSYAALSAGLIALAIYSAAEGNGWRIASVTFTQAAPALLAALVLLSGGAGGRPRRATAAFFAVSFCLHAARGVIGLVDGAAADSQATRWVAGLAYADAIGVSALLALGFLLMINERSKAEERDEAAA